MEISAYYDINHQIIMVSGEEYGKLTTDKAQHAAWLAKKISDESKCNLILFDIRRQTEGQSAIKGFWAMNDLVETMGLGMMQKCAVVYNPLLYAVERAEFIEGVVTTRSNPRFKMFLLQEEAISWLKEEE